ncbi:Hypothetical predicted protein [Paramuricea clavata]|uniref:Uncharacterized protein n=1 Tax=Paramuricea clavata TaxID=317549 RepID=A0A7D9I818_PARCT|nr:Hypothetical predicted protein [Paramuricea clavata]
MSSGSNCCGITLDPKKDLQACVDRNYMLRHGLEFFGAELPHSFYAKSTAYPVSDGYANVEEEMKEGEEKVEDEEKITPQKQKEICDGFVPYYLF